MTWIAVSTGRRPLAIPDARSGQDLMPKGTLILETKLSNDADKLTILDMQRQLDWANRLRLVQAPGGRLIFEHRVKDTIVRCVARFRPIRGERCRITVSWHAPKRVGLICIEDLETGKASYTSLQAPMPWTVGDAAALVSGQAKLHQDVTALAVSDSVEPTGLSGGVEAGTQIETSLGPRPAGSLRPGELVRTACSGLQPIRDIATYEAPNIGTFTPVSLGAPSFGLIRDIQVAQAHKFMVTGADAEYLFGTETVLVEARHLGRIAMPVEKSRSKTVRYVQIVLESHMCMDIGGGWVESYFVGDLPRRKVRYATSVFAKRPCALPEHNQLASQSLRGYEAAVLVSSLCA